MAYSKNGGGTRVVDFKEGQPVYKKGRVKNGNRYEGGSRYENGGKPEGRGQRDRRGYGPKANDDERAPRRGYGERNDERNTRYGERSDDRRRGYGERSEGRPARFSDGRTRTDRRPRMREDINEGRSYAPARGAGRMEDFPHDIPPRRRREADNDTPEYRRGRRFEPAERYAEYDRPAENAEEQELPNIIMGRNPVKEAIKSGRSIDRILVTKEHDGSLNEILDLARDAKLVVRDVDRAKLDEICMPFGHNGRTGNHQGIIAYIPGVEYCELSDILEFAAEKGEQPFVVLLDGIEDPHNLGSIIRSAECAGAHGIVITKRRSASVTAAVVKTAAGATEHIKIAKVVNLSVAIERLKEAGVWVAGADMEGEPLYSADLTGPFALVIGAEGAGISRLVAQKCDRLVSIPLMGRMESLNASVAAAVIMFEKVRQESAK